MLQYVDATGPCIVHVGGYSSLIYYGSCLYTESQSHTVQQCSFFANDKYVLQELKGTLKDKHIEDMHAQMSAHRATIESIKEQADRAKLTELETQKMKMDKEKGNIYVI